ncbi:hypothetical protein GOP47_0013379 [Adiantum capillus-veneris]|uniref:Uncharacterized protein n=1 Tax=Adiantum capillus-veneris TaxID=13818 RepID=A0A9D4UNE2_ADICA|nr:hypothetical protein GOP47_0013379 [Adiantum capillus-veneris]
MGRDYGGYGDVQEPQQPQEPQETCRISMLLVHGPAFHHYDHAPCLSSCSQDHRLVPSFKKILGKTSSFKEEHAVGYLYRDRLE